MVISPTASWIRWCMWTQLMWTCLVWAEQSTPDSFRVPRHRFNTATGVQKGITQTIYTDSKLTSRLSNSLMPSAKLRSANLPVFTSLVWRGRDWTPASRTLSGRSNHYATQGWYSIIVRWSETVNSCILRNSFTNIWLVVWELSGRQWTIGLLY